MSEVAATAEPTQPTPEQSELDYHRDCLNGFIGTARDFAALLLETAKRHANPPSVTACAAAFDRVGCGMRRAILLVRHIAEHGPAVAREPTPPHPAAPTRPDANPSPTRDITPNPSPEHPDRRDPRDTLDRLDTLDQLDSIADLLRRPLPKAVAVLQRDLVAAFRECSKPTQADPTPPGPHRPATHPPPH